MIDLSKIQRYDKPHKVFIPSKYGLYVKEEDIIPLLNQTADLLGAGSDNALLGEVRKIANNVLYFSDNNDYKTALWQILKKVAPELFINDDSPDLDYIE